MRGTPGRIIPPGPADFEARLRRLEGRLGRLERAPSMPETSQTGGSFVLYAEDGTELFRFGDYNDVDATERYGVALFDANGAIVLATDEDRGGLVWPGDLTQWGTTTPTAVTGAAFADFHSTGLAGINGNVLFAQGAVTTDVGTTGEVRVRYASNDAVTVGNTNAVAVGSGGSIIWQLAWLHPFDKGLTVDVDLSADIVSLWLEARRTAGAGNVYVYRPRFLWVTSDRIVNGAAAAGAALSLV